MRVTFKIDRLWVKQTIFRMWIGLIQLFEGFDRTKTDLTEQQRILPAGSLRTWIVTLAFPWVSSLQAYPADFGLAVFHNYMNQFRKINPFLSLYRCTLRYKRRHTHTYGLWLAMINAICICTCLCVLNSLCIWENPIIGIFMCMSENRQIEFA